MKYCLKCQFHTCRDEALYCPCCGSNVVEAMTKCPNCEQEVLEGDLHCVHCGASLLNKKA
jgi:hypothetical protein